MSDQNPTVSFPAGNLHTVDVGHGVSIWVGPSAGSDGAVVVFIDTEFEPDASDGGPGLRVLINDDVTYAGVPYAPLPEDEDG